MPNFLSLRPELLSRLDYPCVGLLVSVRVEAFFFVYFVLLAFTPVPVFADCLLPLNQVTPQGYDAGVPMVKCLDVLHSFIVNLHLFFHFCLAWHVEAPDFLFFYRSADPRRLFYSSEASF